MPAGFTDYRVDDTNGGLTFLFRPDPSQHAVAAYYQGAYPRFVGPDVVGQGLAGARVLGAGQVLLEPAWRSQKEFLAILPSAGSSFCASTNDPSDPLPTLCLTSGRELPAERDDGALEPDPEFGFHGRWQEVAMKIDLKVRRVIKFFEEIVIRD